MSKVIVVPLLLHRRQKHSLRQRSGLAAFGSNFDIELAEPRLDLLGFELGS
jgi:hypothetical protein